MKIYTKNKMMIIRINVINHSNFVILDYHPFFDFFYVVMDNSLK